MSGHSKWANIKHKKAAKDARRGKLFTKLAKEITISAREGGGDPEANPRLRLAIQNARAMNMPMENIKRAIQRGTGEIQGENYEEVIYEGYAPLGVAVVIEAVTDNRNRTFPLIRSEVNKLGGSIGEPGSVMWNFERKSVIYIDPEGRSEEEMLEHIVETGCDDMEYDEERTRIICPFDALSFVQKYFEEKNFKILETRYEYIPKNIITIEKIEEAKKIVKFFDTLEEIDDVQNVYGNYEFTDEILKILEKEQN
ncbi:MAG: YebC/PmpR family DNA-binding transcriptional regulator [Ignavibacteria bacterium]|nr:YebC/PmpR family DNA-binding transcriptional regulator [Ignavibacteria bacterium]